MGIKDLNQGTLTTASQIPFYDPSNGQDRRASVSSLTTLVALSLPASADGFVTQYAAPAALGFGVIIAPPQNGESVFLLLTPTGAFATGGVTLPAQATCVDGQEFLLTTTQAVTTFTVLGNGSTVNGAPATLAANAFFRLRFDGVFKAWYRVG